MKKEISYAKLIDLTEGIKVDLDNPDIVINRIAEKLKETGLCGRIKLGIGIRKAQNQWLLELDEKNCTVSRKELENPDLEIFTRVETGIKIAKGLISPIEAFAKGKMRIRGNIDLAMKLYKFLASEEGKIFPCV